MRTERSEGAGVACFQMLMSGANLQMKDMLPNPCPPATKEESIVDDTYSADIATQHTYYTNSKHVEKFKFIFEYNIKSKEITVRVVE